MIKGIKLTEEQKDLLTNQLFAENSYFNPIQDINDDWFITDIEQNNTINPNFIWVKDLEITDIELKPVIPIG